MFYDEEDRLRTYSKTKGFWTHPSNHRFSLQGYPTASLIVKQSNTLLLSTQAHFNHGIAYGDKQIGEVYLKLHPNLSSQRFLSNMNIRSISMIQPIKTGTIHFPSIEGKTYQIEEGEYLHLDELNGQIMNVYLGEEGTTAEFSGTANKIISGRPYLQKDLMPSKMDYILANRGNKLFYEITLAIIGLIYSVYLWFKSHK